VSFGQRRPRLVLVAFGGVRGGQIEVRGIYLISGVYRLVGFFDCSVEMTEAEFGVGHVIVPLANIRIARTQAHGLLPDLRGRAALGIGQGTGLQSYNLGQAGGVESVALAGSQFASHTHNLMAASTATTPTPGTGVVLGTPAAATSTYATTGTGAALSSATVSPSSGGGQPHENRQPSATINYIISLFGIFPSQA
jgi:microcystin-dependent protein